MTKIDFWWAYIKNEKIPEAQEGDEEDVGVPGVGLVGDGSPGPSP